jgi:hypothetical protein
MCPSVDQQVAFAVEDEHAEGTVQHPQSMGFHLLHGAQGAVFGVDKDDPFRLGIHRLGLGSL